MKILVAEDDAVSRLILHRAVERLGHTCDAVADGAEAWEHHRASPADVIVSDWMMPGIDGLELCRRVRAGDATSYTYFIVLTALGEKEHLLTGMRAGADDYLRKPVDLDELEACLIAATRVTSIHKRLFHQNAELERLGRASHEAARIDPLTHVANRLRLREDLDAMRARVVRYGHVYCAALCDVDWFKLYNDHYGHLGGDDALRAVADSLKSALRSGDTVYRYGGEEFLAILPEQTLAGAEKGMDRARRAIEALAIPHAATTPPGVLTISCGVAQLIAGATESVEDWLKRADQALYRAKGAGRNRVEIAPDPEPV